MIFTGSYSSCGVFMAKVLNRNVSKDLFDLIKSLPFRTYRDSADVAIDLIIPLPL
jgi:hypothetical protein